MTDKLDPGWVNDRLPTEEDADIDGHVCKFYPGGKYGYVKYRRWKDIKKGEMWAVNKVSEGGGYPRLEQIARPSECLDRAKGDSEVDEPSHFGMVTMKHKIDDLEQALVKEQAEHAETKERVKDLEGIAEKLSKNNMENLKTFVSQETENELLRKLLKSLL